MSSPIGSKLNEIDPTVHSNYWDGQPSLNIFTRPGNKSQFGQLTKISAEKCVKTALLTTYQEYFDKILQIFQ